MGFEMPYTEEEINSASKKIIATQKVENGYVRPVAWRGSEMMAISAQKKGTEIKYGIMKENRGRPSNTLPIKKRKYTW